MITFIRQTECDYILELTLMGVWLNASQRLSRGEHIRFVIDRECQPVGAGTEGAILVGEVNSFILL